MTTGHSTTIQDKLFLSDDIELNQILSALSGGIVMPTAEFISGWLLREHNAERGH